MDIVNPGGSSSAGTTTPANASSPPSINSYLAWSFPAYRIANSANSPTAGTLMMQKMWVPSNITVNNIDIYQGATLGVTLTNSFLGIYDAAGNLLGTTADRSAALAAAATTAIFASALTAPVAITGGASVFVYACIQIGSAATMPVLGNDNAPVTAAAINAGTTAGTFVSSALTSGNAALPSTVTMASQTSSTKYYWIGLR